MTSISRVRRSLLRAAACAALLLLTTPAFVAAGTYQEGKVYRHALENGMTVITVERHIAPFIYHQLTYNVGSRNERLGITGISHVVEHMMFKGTPTYQKGKTSRLISDAAGIFNAFTSNDMTSYFEYLPANRIELAFDIESDRMQNCIFDPVEFQSEIQVILQERRMRSESNPQGVLSEELNACAFLSHPNRDPIIGWPGDLRHISRDDAFTYYRTYYTPNNSILVLVGDFDTGKILALARKYYGRIPRGPAVPPVWAVEQDQRVRRTVTLYHNDVVAPIVRMAWHAPVYSDSDAAALRLAGMIMGERSRDSRLYKRLVEKERIATTAGGGIPIGKDPVLFSISVGVVPDSSVERAEAIVWEEIERIQKEPVSEHELQKVKNRHLFTQVTEYTKNPDIGSRISRYESYFGWDFFAEFERRIQEVTAGDIQRVMKRYFGRSNVTVAYAYPKEGKKARKGAPAEGEDGEAQPADPSVDGERCFLRPPLDVPELLAVAADSAAGEEFPRPKAIAPLIRQMTLDNGITLYTIENHLVPALFLGGKIETGTIPEAVEGQKPGVAAVLGDVMNRGTRSMPYEQLSERLAFVPYSFSASGSYRGFTFQGYALTKDADEMVRTGYEVITSPGFRDGDISTVKRRHIIAARDRFKKTGVAAFYYMFNKLFENHLFSRTNSTVASVTAITEEDLRELHGKYFRPERTTIVMMGDMAPEQMRTLASAYFGKWKVATPAPPVEPVPPVSPLAAKELKVFTEKDYTECTINMGFSPFNAIDPGEEEIVAVMNSILAGSVLTSRIGVELRDRQGLIYGIKSELWAPKDRIGYWKFNTKTGPQNVEKVLLGIFGEIRKLLARGITEEELARAKSRQLGLLPLWVETPDDIASRVFELLDDHLPFDHFDKKADRIKAVTAEDVLRVARKYFTLDRYVVVVDGPIGQEVLDRVREKL